MLVIVIVISQNQYGVYVLDFWSMLKAMALSFALVATFRRVTVYTPLMAVASLLAFLPKSNESLNSRQLQSSRNLRELQQ